VWPAFDHDLGCSVLDEEIALRKKELSQGKITTCKLILHRSYKNQKTSIYGARYWSSKCFFLSNH
jgi:hypothetical protein